jgi:hypothetical protein
MKQKEMKEIKGPKMISWVFTNFSGPNFVRKTDDNRILEESRNNYEAI